MVCGLDHSGSQPFNYTHSAVSECVYSNLLCLQYRSEILNCFRRVLNGLGLSSASAHKDMYKCVRSGLTDKSLAVRSAAAKVD